MADVAIEFSLLVKDAAWRKEIKNLRAFAKRWCELALNEGLEDTNLKQAKSYEISLVLADDRFVQELNHQYRGKAKPTNVLSFPAGEGFHAPHSLEIGAGSIMLGDVILARETVAREAEAQHKPFVHHAAHLIVHGCLHLLGYDHETDDDAPRMEALETSILKKRNIPDPYHGDHFPDH